MTHLAAPGFRKLSLGVLVMGLILVLPLLLTPPAHAVEQTVTMTVSYSIVGPAAKPPVFTYFYQGIQRTATLSTNATAYPVDIGTPWNVTPVLQGTSGNVRWATQVSGGTAANGTTLITYYYQFRVNFGYDVVEGGSGPIDVFGVRQWGRQASVSAGSEVWVDSGSAFSYPSLVQPSPGERWVSNGLNGTIAKPTNLTLQYFHQNLLIARYTAVNGSPTPPVLSGTSFNATVHQTLSGTNSSVWLDSGTPYQATDPLSGSDSNLRWFATGAQGTVSALTYLSLEYYHQYSVTGSFVVVGGNPPAAPQLLSTYFGVSKGEYLTSAPTVYWVDVGSGYNVSGSLLGSSTTERWTMNGGVSGVADSSFSFQAVYYHQYLISLTSEPQASAPTPVLGFTSFGVADSAQLGSVPTSVWGDNGTAISVVLNSVSAPGARWVVGPPLPATLTAPLDGALSLFHQFDVSLSYSVSGGGTPPPPVLSGTSLGVPVTANLSASASSHWLDAGTTWTVAATIPGQTSSERWAAAQATGGALTGPVSSVLAFARQYYFTMGAAQGPGTSSPSSGWYDAASAVSLSATPAQGSAFLGWQGTGSGAYTGANSTVSIVVNGPISEVPAFGPQLFSLQVAAGDGGSVTYSYGGTQGSVQGAGSTLLSAPPGTNVTLGASPSSFLYSFSGWSGAATSSNGTVQLTLDSSSQVVATFALNGAALAGIIGLWAAAVVAVAYLLKHRGQFGELRRTTLARSRLW